MTKQIFCYPFGSRTQNMSGHYIFFSMPPKPYKKRDRVAGKMTLKEFMYRHTPLDAPSNEFKDEMYMKDAMHKGEPLALEDLRVSQNRDSVLNVNLDEMLREIDVLLHSSPSNQNLKWVDALDQLYHDFLHRSKVQSPIYPGSPSPLSNISANSQLGKRRRPNKTVRSKPPQIMVNQWMNDIPAAPTRNDLQNPQQTKISPPRKITEKKRNNKRPLSGSDIYLLTAKSPRRSKSSSVGSNNSKGSLHLSELKTQSKAS